MFFSGQCGHTSEMQAAVGGRCNYSFPEAAKIAQESAPKPSQDQQLLTGHGIVVTYSQLIVGGQRYPVDTIRSIVLVEKARKTVWPEMSFRAGLFVILVALLQALSGAIELTLVGVLVGLVLVATGLFSLLTAKPEYSVQMGRTTGEIMEIHVSQDRVFVEELIRTINHIVATRVESATT